MRNLIFLILMLCTRVYALSDEEMKGQMVRLIMKCHKDHPVDMSELLKLQTYVVPQKTEVKCLLACAYKKEGILNDKGLYDVAHGYAVAEIAKNGDETRLANGKKIVEICSKVNEMEVSDGEKGCDRAALIFKCTVDNAPKLGFKI